MIVIVKGDGVSTDLRMRNALYAVGTPILQSASSTILGVSFLASTESYVFRSFLKVRVSRGRVFHSLSDNHPCDHSRSSSRSRHSSRSSHSLSLSISRGRGRRGEGGSPPLPPSLSTVSLAVISSRPNLLYEWLPHQDSAHIE